MNSTMSVGYGGSSDADVSRETSTARTVSLRAVPHPEMFHVKHVEPSVRDSVGASC